METDQKYPYEAATAKQRKIGSYWWNIHHMDLIEILTEPMGNRVKCIRECKPEGERECRLRNMAPVLQPEVLPWAYTKAVKACTKVGKAYDKAGEAYTKAWKAHDRAGEADTKAVKACTKVGKAYDKAGEAYTKAMEACTKARKACTKELETLHKGEYPNNTWTGKSIFEKK